MKAVAYSALTLAIMFSVHARAAQTIYVNGQVITPGGTVQAMAVKDGKIVAVGTNDDIRRDHGAGADTVDLNSKTVLPGFFDMHVHPLRAGNGAGGWAQTPTQEPTGTPQQQLSALKAGLNVLLSNGVTGLTDAMVSREDLLAYDALADSGELHQTVRTCIAYSKANSGKKIAAFDALLAGREKFARPNLRTDCVKVFLDGVPTVNHTAAMLEPYADAKAGTPTAGKLLIDGGALNKAVAAWDKQGLTVLFHAAGDAAVRAALDAVEFARQGNGPAGPRHQIGHSTFVAKEDFRRAKPLGATFEFSPYLWYPQPVTDEIREAVGPERMSRAWPVREGVRSGALLVLGSDWAAVADPNPWMAIETALTHQKPGAQGASFAIAETISVRRAIELFTINGAKQMGMEDRLGSLEAGKQADFIVLDRDPFKTAVAQLHDVRVERTYIAGEKVFDRAAAPN